METPAHWIRTGAWRQEYRYSVYEHKLTGPDGMIYSRSFIVVKHRSGVIVRFTRLHKYAGAYENQMFRPLASDAKAKLHYICKMLNYIIVDHYETFGIDHVFKVTKKSLNSFFTDYAMQKKSDGGYRGRQSIKKCISAVTQFFWKLERQYCGYVTLSRDELYIEQETRTQKGTLVKKWTPDFQVRGIPGRPEIFRDLPTKVFQILLNLAVRYTPDIAFAISLQAFAGLRPGEICNVRQETSPKGRGLLLTIAEGRVVKAEIDLTREYTMRSDGVVCGRIKCERKQCVYPPFLDAFEKLYQYHKRFLASHPFETEYCPMFVNKNGKAMTYDDYYGRFRQLVENHLRPQLLCHTDPECRIYGQMLCENRLGPHVLRHWFSVQLALRGEDVAQLQYWRGDRNPESAFLYLQDKGDLVRELSAANELLAERLLEEGAASYGGD